MNIPPDIQSQQTKWMEVILIWLGICLPIKFGPVVYQSWQYRDSTPELLINNLVALLILAISLGLLLKYKPLSSWILKTSSSHSETSRRDSDLSGWLTMGIFTCGFLILVHTVQRMLTILGSYLSLWFHPTRETIGVNEETAWFFVAVFCLNIVPQLTIALFLTFSPQRLEKWSICLQKRWGFRKTESLIS